MVARRPSFNGNLISFLYLKYQNEPQDVNKLLGFSLTEQLLFIPILSGMMIFPC